MRLSTVLSFLVAALLAVVAVLGTQAWLRGQQQEISASVQRELAAQQEKVETETIVVAAEPIAFGEELIESKLREIEWNGSIRPEGSFDKIENFISEDGSRFALSAMSTGEPILAARVTAPGQRAKLSTILGEGMKAVTIRVNDVLGVAGFVLPGDRVDILLMTGGGQNAYVDVLLQGVKVLAIDQVSNEQADRPIVSRSVTLEVNTEQSQKLVLAANVGTLALTLRNVSSTDIEDFDRVTFKDLNDFDAADDIVEALVQEAVEAQQIDPTVERLESLEELLKNLSVGINQRIEGVEQTLIEQDAVAESENVVVSEPEPVRLPVFVVPEKSTVGVIRNGSRVEYDVLVEGEDDASAGDSAGN